ncbi:MAG: NTE family protein [Arcticibacterium sp.]|jgi:NTE family protein
MKALIISGGGSKGSFAGGVAEYLINDCCHEYDLFVGSSAGSLLLTHLALKKVAKIKEIFTSVSQEDIFNISPFRIKKSKAGEIETKINHFNTIRSFIKGCPTFGESNNLLELIRNSITKEEFQDLRVQSKKVIFTVSNLTLDKVEYFNSNDSSYDQFCNWAWASCNFTPFMSLFSENNCQYADGGFGSYTPILCAIENGASDIDVIILESENGSSNHPVINNPFSLLLRTFKFMNNQSNSKDIIIGKLVGLNRKVNINFYYTPSQLTTNPLVFDPEQMTQWWKEGYEFAKAMNPENYCHVPA